MIVFRRKKKGSETGDKKEKTKAEIALRQAWRLNGAGG